MEWVEPIKKRRETKIPHRGVENLARKLFRFVTVLPRSSAPQRIRAGRPASYGKKARLILLRKRRAHGSLTRRISIFPDGLLYPSVNSWLILKYVERFV